MFAETMCGGTIDSVPIWALYTFIILMISFAIYITMYFITKVIRLDKTSANITSEITQLIYTAGLFALIIMLFNGFCHFDIGVLFDTVSPGYSDHYNPYCESNNCITPYQYASAYLMKMTTFTSQTLIVTTLSSSMIKSVSNAEQSLAVSKFQMFKGIGTIADFALSMGGYAQVTILLLFITQFFILAYSSNPMFGVFLPIGFMLRSFAPTRFIGGAIIGAVLTLSIFFPLLLMINGLIAKEMPIKTMGDTTMLYMKSIVTIWGTYTLATLAERGLNFLSAHGIVGSQESLSGVFLVLAKIKSIASTAFFWTMLTGIILFVLSIYQFTGVLFLTGVVFPIISFLILSQISIGLSSALGERLDISNLTRMV
ncbi:hypothetical protein KO465_00290 [Candidatus Micrarchaeota archaeon]|nr:hypothetical protein [Candidatus Micrarchaeota archaeon]